MATPRRAVDSKAEWCDKKISGNALSVNTVVLGSVFWMNSILVASSAIVKQNGESISKNSSRTAQKTVRTEISSYTLQALQTFHTENSMRRKDVTHAKSFTGNVFKVPGIFSGVFKGSNVGTLTV